MWSRPFIAVYPQKLCNGKLRFPVKSSDIDHVHRVRRAGTVPRQILVKFATHGTRASVYKAKSVFRPRGRHPHSPWTLDDTAGVTSDPAAAEAPPPEEPTADDDAVDDYGNGTGLDYSKNTFQRTLTGKGDLYFGNAEKPRNPRR